MAEYRRFSGDPRPIEAGYLLGHKRGLMGNEDQHSVQGEAGHMSQASAASGSQIDEMAVRRACQS
jgi:hypothetical protein